MTLHLMPNPKPVTVQSLMQQLLEEARFQKLTPQQFSAQARVPYSMAYRTLKGKSKRISLYLMLALAGELGFTCALSMGLEPNERAMRALERQR